MQITLAPELERWIAEKIECGRYRDASEAVAEGLLLLAGADDDTQVEDLRAQIRVGLAQLDAGEGIPGEHVKAEVMAQLATFRR